MTIFEDENKHTDFMYKKENSRRVQNDNREAG